MDFPPVPLPIKRWNQISASYHHADKKGAPRLTLGEVTTLQHELRDDTVEGASFVSESMLASSKLAEVFGGIGNNIVKELEDDATSGLTVDGDIKLVFIRREIRIARSRCEKSSPAHSTGC